MRHIIDLSDLSMDEFNELYALTTKIIDRPEDYAEACRGKVLGSLFYEPSTRTNLSFSTAMMRLGGSVVGFSDPNSSSAAKGESLKDTISMVSNYADMIVMRNPKEGAAYAASLYSAVPVINAGDGGHLHPTQTLTDLLTLKMEKGRLDHLTIGLCGDLLYGRTVHSLCKALSCYPENKFVLISTPELQIPEYITKILHDSGCEYRLESSLDAAIGDLDVLYMTRIQRERFASQAEYLAQKDVYRLTAEKMRRAKEDLIVLHPLPRVDEIEIAVDDDPRAMFFKQAKYGMYVRMALILRLLESEKAVPLLRGTIRNDLCCVNPKCITAQEHYLPHQFTEIGGKTVCEFCEEAAIPSLIVNSNIAAR